jgi:adenylate cyclase
MYIYYLTTWWGLTPYLRPGLFDNYLEGWYVHMEILVQGILFGILFGLINYLSDNTKLRRSSFGTIILVKSFLYSIALIFSQVFVFAIYHIFSIVPAMTFEETQQQVSSRTIISVGIYFLFVVLFVNFILQINRKFGYEDLIAMITGKYHKPRKEQRIFMFLDMKDSTGNAERLGHYNYSRMIQSCIHDLTDLIIRYKAQVYQYVGDEVVLTWPTELGLKDLNCINLFYAFEQRLNDKKKYYQRKYNTIPQFKAGMDEGVITVTEVGDIKREIAYHGEVLHTAARLEKMCNKLEQKILITQNVSSMLPFENGYEKEYMGEFQLRGKENRENVYGIARILDSNTNHKK